MHSRPYVTVLGELKLLYQSVFSSNPPDYFDKNSHFTSQSTADLLLHPRVSLIDRCDDIPVSQSGHTLPNLRLSLCEDGSILPIHVE